MTARSLLFRLLTLVAPLALRLGGTRLRVLAYHTVPYQAQFALQMAYLARHYQFISLAQLEAHLFEGMPLPPRALLLTFDDGDVSVLERGLPVLQQFKAPAVLFVVTGLIDSEKPFWWEQVVAHYRSKGLTHAAARAQVTALKTVPNVERERVLATMGAPPTRQLTTAELNTLQAGGVVIANHSHAHPMFDQCTEAELVSELLRARTCFERWPDGRPDVFAYPNGNASALAHTQLLQAGIRLAFVFDHRLNRKKIDPMAISRIRVNSYDALPEFKVRVSGIHSWLSFRR